MLIKYLVALNWTEDPKKGRSTQSTNCAHLGCDQRFDNSGAMGVHALSLWRTFDWRPIESAFRAAVASIGADAPCRSSCGLPRPVFGRNLGSVCTSVPLPRLQYAISNTLPLWRSPSLIHLPCSSAQFSHRYCAPRPTTRLQFLIILKCLSDSGPQITSRTDE